MVFKKILFISSVDEEMPSFPLKSSEKIKIINNNVIVLKKNGVTFFFLVTGIGILNTVSSLTLAIDKIAPDLIVQIGIGGAFKNSGLKIGDVVIAEKDIYIDYGVERNNRLNDFFIFEEEKEKLNEIYEADKNIVSFFYSKIKEKFGNLKKGVFITSSTITTTQKRADLIEKNLNAFVESMEGVALFHSAKLFKIPFIEIRSISNFVSDRDKKKWDKKTAFQNIKDVADYLIKNIKKT